MSISFKDEALLHQKFFMHQQYGININNARNTLEEDDARQFSNFYRDWFGLQTELRIRYPFDKNKTLYKSIIHPKHLAINFFLPIKAMKENYFIKMWLQHATGREVAHIHKVSFFYPKKQRSAQENSGFEVLMDTMLAEGKRFGIGISIRYTDENALYEVPEGSKRVCPHSITHLQNHVGTATGTGLCFKRLQQENPGLLWQNQLLGLSIVQKGQFEDFMYWHLYPSGNDYQEKAAKMFLEHLSEEPKCLFQPLTFEAFFQQLKPYVQRCDEDAIKWHEYITKRYAPNIIL